MTDPERRRLRREYVRIYRDAKRRERGAKQIGRSRPTAVDRAERVLLPREPLADALSRWPGTDGELAVRSGVSDRYVYRVRTGESQWVRLGEADRLVVAMGLHLYDVFGDIEGWNGR